MVEGADLWKVSLAIADQQTGLPTPAVPHHNEFLREGGWLCYVCRCRHLGIACRCAERAVAAPMALMSEWLSSRRDRARRWAQVISHRATAAKEVVVLCVWLRHFYLM